MSVTMKDVAARAGVSRSAVSRTFTTGASVSDKTRAKVEQAAAELRYRPNALASSLTTGRTKLIGLVSNNFHNPIFLEVFDLFTRKLQSRGLRPLLVNLTDETDPANSLSLLKQYSVDGVIVASSTLSPEFSLAFQEAQIPVVHSFGRFASAPEVPVVGIDNVECGRMAARTLLARGYRDVGFLGGPREASSTIDRHTGFMEVMRSASDTVVRESYAQAYSYFAGHEEMTRLLNGPVAQVYFCGDDVLSVGALTALQESGRRVPEDVGVLGLNDMEMARWPNINLTTIRQPIQQIISSSVELVMGLIDAPDRIPEARLFSCQIIERGTLRPVTGTQE